LISYSVEGRTHELGVRASLGAGPMTLIRLIVAQGVRFALVGIGIGVALALLAARWIEPLLFRQSATDPVTLFSVGGIMLAVAVIASVAPAWRASRADPGIALRAE
jgi:ABC-type antimicrobial peptide transport system permease subunit